MDSTGFRHYRAAATSVACRSNSTKYSNEFTPIEPLDVIALDDALRRLAVLDPQKAQLVELRYFAGLSIPEAAEALGVSTATIGREWAIARMWLRRELDQ